MRRLAVLVLLAGLARAVLHAAFPASSGPINDFSGVLSTQTRSELAALAADVEAQTTAEIALAVVTSLDGMSVEECANRLFHEWGIGRKQRDNGVLILVSPSDRKMRIEVGYGLEPILPDGLAGEIIRTDFLPAFRKDDYQGGIVTGFRHVAAIVKAREIVTPEERKRLMEAEGGNGPPAWFVLPFLSIFVAIGSLALGVGLRTKTWGPLLMGALFAGFPMIIALAFFFVGSLFTIVPLLLLLGVVGYVKGGQSSWRSAARGSSSEAGNDWISGGSSSSSSGGSSSDSSSSDSSSFGGGDSGGGGASGSW